MTYSYVGVDFGTTNSSIAVMDELKQKPFELEFAKGYGVHNQLLRTLLSFAENGEVLAEEIKEPGRTLRSFKRRMMENPGFTYESDGKVYGASELIALFLQDLFKKAGVRPDRLRRLVLSVPTHYKEELKNTMEAAAVRCGVPQEAIWFIDEPISVLWNYHSRKMSGERLLVFDFGGGTLDLAVMNRSDNMEGINSAAHVLHSFGSAGSGHNFARGKVLAKKGIEIGGDDLDEIVMRYILEEGQKQNNPVCLQLKLDLFDSPDRLQAFRRHTVYDRLKQFSEAMKIELSDQDRFTLSVPPLMAKHDLNGIRGITLTADEFVRRAEAVWSKIRNGIRELEKELREKHRLGLADIDAILLSGGSSKVPFVMDILEELLPNAALRFDDHMQTSICRGNALYSYHDDEVMIADEVNSAYGLFSHVHRTTKVAIEETDTYPITVKKRMATTKPYQEAIRIIPMVRKGSSDFEPIRKNGSPIYYSMKIKPMQDTMNYGRITVDFTVDKSQKLKITAYDNLMRQTVGVEEINLNEID